MKVTVENPYWGTVYKYNDADFRFALYSYNDDRGTIYLSNIRVEPSKRKNGIGNAILSVAEDEAREKGASTIVLKVMKSSWVHDWYEDHGYVDFCYDEDPDFMWMRKLLK